MDGLVVGLQNSMAHEEIASILGRHRTIGAVTEITSNMWTPDVTTRQNAHDESWFAMGAIDPATQPRVYAVADMLRHSGTVEVVDDIRSAKWMKLVVNAAVLIPSAIVDTALNEAARTPGMPTVMSNYPERYVDQIIERVLTT